MNDGDITGNGATYSGGGVFVGSDGIFNMTSGTITGKNTANSGGAVYIDGTFDMSGGAISGNEAVSRDSGIGSGGGVSVGSGEFNMTGGTISENNAHIGAGVYTNSTFIMNGSGTIISGNQATSAGGGVYVGSSGEFYISDGIVYGNEDTTAQNLRNTAQDGGGASLFITGFEATGIAQYENGLNWIDIGTEANDDYGNKLRDKTIDMLDGVWKE